MGCVLLMKVEQQIGKDVWIYERSTRYDRPGWDEEHLNTAFPVRRIVISGSQVVESTVYPEGEIFSVMD